MSSRTFFRNHIRLLLFFLLVTGFDAAAQQPYFKRIFINRENSSLKFSRIFRDHRGFLWIGSSEGLYRLDGAEPVLYAVNDTNFDNKVTAIYQDSHETIWIGYKSGQIASLVGRRLSVFQPEEGMPRKPVTSISNDSHGNLWFTTAGEGVYYYTRKRLYNINTDDGLNDNYAYTLSPGRDGEMWVGTDEGLAACSAGQKKKVLKTFHKKDGLPDNIVRVVVADSTGNLWLGLQQKGICRYLVKENKFVVPAPVSSWTFGQVNSITQDGSEMWISTDESGLVFFDVKKNRKPVSYKDFNKNSFPNVADATIDHEGNTWMVTGSNVFQSSGNRITIANNIGGVDLKMIHSLLIDKQGTLWFTPDQGLVACDRNDSTGIKIRKYTITPPNELMDIVSLYEDDCHYIWIGTMGEGLFRLNPKTGNIQKITGHTKLNKASIMAITGKGNVIWIATLSGGLKMILPEDCGHDRIEPVFESPDNEDLLGSFYLYDVFIDSRNRVWFGTDGKGITCLDKDAVYNYNENVGLMSKIIYSITEDEFGNIWFSTSNSGIYRYDGNRFKNYGLAEGLRYLSISGIMADGKGDIVIVHTHGFDVLDIKNERFSYYGPSFGISEINSDLNSICRDQEGRVWIGTEEMIICYDHDGGHYKNSPSTYITRASLFANQVRKDLRPQLAYNQNYLSFDFIGLWYSDPERVKYQYMLEGYNTDWVNTNDRSVIFPNLTPGSYNFKVRSSLNSNFNRFTLATYAFTIRPPFWSETWFIILVSILLCGLIYLFILLRIRHVRRIESLKKEKIEFQFETLKSQVNPHFLFNSFNTLITAIEEDQGKAIEYVETLSAFFRNIVTFKDYDLITVQEELEVAKVYFFLQQKRYGSHLKMETAVDETLKTRQIPPMVLQILLENAVKHNAISSETPLCISITSSGNTLLVKNNINHKRNPEHSTGTGLQNIINRYRLLTTEEVVIRQDEKEFTVVIPLI